LPFLATSIWMATITSGGDRCLLQRIVQAMKPFGLHIPKGLGASAAIGIASPRSNLPL
jgi:hypothetical protein